MVPTILTIITLLGFGIVMGKKFMIYRQVLTEWESMKNGQLPRST